MTRKQIDIICKEYNIQNYTINNDLSIDVYTNVNLSRLGLKELPLKFNNVRGYFNCNSNNLTSLKGSPKVCHLDFHCADNYLKSLEYSPELINGIFDTSNNELSNLNGIGIVKNHIYLFHNPLESLDGYDGDYNKLRHHEIKKLIRKQKLKMISKL